MRTETLISFTYFRLSRWLIINFDYVLGLLHHVVVGNAASTLHISTLKMEEAGTSEMSAT